MLALWNVLILGLLLGLTCAVPVDMTNKPKLFMKSEHNATRKHAKDDWEIIIRPDTTADTHGLPTTTTGGPTGLPTTTTGGPSGLPTTSTGGPSGLPTTTTGGPTGLPTTTTGGPSGLPTTSTGGPSGLPTTTTGGPSGLPTTTTGGPTVADVDECAEGLDACDANAVCENVRGRADSYKCTCGQGFYDAAGDGKLCTANVGECAESDAKCICLVGTCACENHWHSTDGSTCVEMTGECTESGASCTCTSGNCMCDVGFHPNQGGEKKCEANTGECAEGTDKCECLSTGVCSCKSGYQFLNSGCTDIDECAAGTDDCGAKICSNNGGGFDCQLTDGTQIGYWMDTTTGGYDVSTVQDFPTYYAARINGKPGFKFSGNNFLASAKIFPKLNIYTWFVVFFDSSVGWHNIFSTTEAPVVTGGSYAYYPSSMATSGEHGWSRTPNRDYSDGNSPQGLNVVCYRYSQTTGKFDAWRTRATGGPVKVIDNWSVNFDNVPQGYVAFGRGMQNGHHPYSGYIGEALVYDRAFSDGEVSSLSISLQTKWNTAGTTADPHANIPMSGLKAQWDASYVPSVRAY